MPGAVRSAGTAPKRSRAESYALARTLRDRGMSGVAIAETLGLSSSYVYELLNDPTGGGSRARKDSYRGVCEGCGGTTTGSEGPSKVPRFCHLCSGRAYAKWSFDLCVDAIRRFHAMFDDWPRVEDFNPAMLDHTRYCSPERRARVLARHAAGDWPEVSTVQYYCGTWNAAIAAAGGAVFVGRRRVATCR